MRTTAVVIGAGHAGLAMSRCLAERSIDHVVLERGEVANSWRTERWDSLRLLTPNWQSRLPGYGYEGDDPDGFMHDARDHRVHRALRRSDRRRRCRPHTTVTSVRRDGDGYRVATDQGDWQLPDGRARDAERATSPRVPSARRSRAAGDRAADADAVPQSGAARRRAACSSSAPRRPASSSPTRSTARAGR